MHAPIDGIDDDVSSIVEFIGEAFGRNASDHRCSRRCWIMDRKVAALGGECPLHGPHDVVAVFQSPEDALRVAGELPTARLEFACAPQALQALQAPEYPRPPLQGRSVIRL